jgi:histone H3/H4
MQSSGDGWKACGTCKKPIHHGRVYWVCSVSTCNGARFSPVYCTVGCWDAHVPVMNHRSAWCEERTAPPRPPSLPPGRGDSDELRARLMKQMSQSNHPVQDKDVLVVSSKLKKYIKERAGMNCSADVLEILSDYIRHQANDAIDRAREDSRKTVKAKDFMPR